MAEDSTQNNQTTVAGTTVTDPVATNTVEINAESSVQSNVLADVSEPAVTPVVPEWLKKVQDLKQHEENVRLDDKGNVLLPNDKAPIGGVAANETMGISDSSAASSLPDGLVFEGPENSASVAPIITEPVIDFTVPSQFTESVVAVPVPSGNVVLQEKADVPDWLKNIQETSAVEQKIAQEGKPLSDQEKAMLDYVSPPEEAAGLPVKQAMQASLNVSETGEKKPDVIVAAVPSVSSSVEQKLTDNQQQKIKDKQNIFEGLKKGFFDFWIKEKLKFRRVKRKERWRQARNCPVRRRVRVLWKRFPR
jgi:hypothetical protein